MAPVIIKEITRRVNLCNVWQAVYTAGVVIPKPIATATYLHRSLNAKKLIEVGFSALPTGETMAGHLKKNKIPKESEISIAGFPREMLKKDLSHVYALLKVHLGKFKLRPKLTMEEVGHLLLPRDSVIYSFVVEDPETKAITDFMSFYRLPTQILRKEGHSHSTIEVR